MKKNNLFVMMLASGMMAVTPVMADTVKLTTSKAVGETVTIELNQPKQEVTVDWGDGKPATVAKTADDHLVLTGQVKGSVITVTSQSRITMLLCANSGLTAIDLTQAPNLLSLYCQNNSLATLDIAACQQLVDLNCSNNQLTKINITYATHPALENVNLADNKLRSSSTYGSVFTLPNENLQHLDISNNNFGAVSLVEKNAKLDVLKLSNNVVTDLNLAGNAKLSAVLATNNSLSKVALAKEPAQLRQLFVENNNLKTLDVSAAKALDYLAVDSNMLTEVNLPETSLYAYTCKSNALNFASLPGRRQKPTHFAYLPQQEDIDIKNQLTFRRGEYFLTMCPSYDKATEAKYRIDLSPYAFDADNRRVVIKAYAVVDGQPVELKKAPSATRPGDYHMLSTEHGKIAFLKAYDEVYVELTSGNYPDLKFTTTHFRVKDPNNTAINDVTTDAAAALEVSASNGRLVLQSATAQVVSVYATSGKLVWKGQVADAPVAVQLPAGVYVVNGKKVVL